MKLVREGEAAGVDLQADAVGAAFARRVADALHWLTRCRQLISELGVRGPPPSALALHASSPNPSPRRAREPCVVTVRAVGNMAFTATACSYPSWGGRPGHAVEVLQGPRHAGARVLPPAQQQPHALLLAALWDCSVVQHAAAEHCRKFLAPAAIKDQGMLGSDQCMLCLSCRRGATTRRR